MELVNECIFQHLLYTTFKDRGEPSVQEPDVTLNEDKILSGMHVGTQG